MIVPSARTGNRGACLLCFRGTAPLAGLFVRLQGLKGDSCRVNDMPEVSSEECQKVTSPVFGLSVQRIRNGSIPLQRLRASVLSVSQTGESLSVRR